MSVDEINKAIAESVGWYFDVEFPEYPWMDSKGEGHKLYPNYHDSLDAIVPVVRALPAADVIEVKNELLFIMENDFIFLATAAQWCEAYLKSKGLWNE